MTWVRMEDGYPINRKVAALSDAAFRLDFEAICWSNRELADGQVRARELTQIRSKATRKHAAELVSLGRWHPAGATCPSELCPANPASPSPATATDGWVIHDYFEQQPTRVKVLADRAVKAERQRNWMAKRRASGDASGSATGHSSGRTSGASTDRVSATPAYANGNDSDRSDAQAESPVLESRLLSSRDQNLRPGESDMIEGNLRSERVHRRASRRVTGTSPVPAPAPAPEGKREGDLPEAPAARRTAADAADGGWSEQPVATNGHTPVRSPDTSALRATIAAAARKAHHPSRAGAFDELREATPDVAPHVESEETPA